MGTRRAERLPPGPGAGRGLRPALRRVLDAARLLRPGRERRDAPPARDPAGGRRTRMTDAVPQRRARRCARCTRELVRWGLVTWTSGNVSARVPGADLMVIKPSGIAYDELTPESMVVTDLHGQRGRRHAAPVVRHALPRLHLPRDARGQRDRPHAQHVRHGMGRPSRGDPVRPHRDGRRVRRRRSRSRRSPASATKRSAGRGVHARAATAHRPCCCATTACSPSAPRAKAAVKAAVMCEDVARTVHHARMLGDPVAHRSGRRRQPVRAVPERLRAEVERPR